MKLEHTYQIPFESEHTILSASLSSADEIVILTSDHQVIRYGINDGSSHLFSVSCGLIGGFDFNAPSTIYTMGAIVVVVNDFKGHGYVFSPGRGSFFPLWRKEYHADITRFPIALFNSEEQVPHLIYSADWNHLQIMDLNTLRIVTATKSLIEVGAEEQYSKMIESNANYTPTPFPIPYNYFYGPLLMSPNKKQFLSKGWVWGSVDSYNVYDVTDFITNDRIAGKQVGVWEHSGRAACWIDDQTVAVSYYPWREGDEGCPPETPVVLHFYDFSGPETTLKSSFVFDALDETSGELYYSKKLDAIIAFAPGKGLSVYSLDGTLLLRNTTFTPTAFYPEFDLFLTTDTHSLSIHKLSASA